MPRNTARPLAPVVLPKVEPVVVAPAPPAPAPASMERHRPVPPVAFVARTVVDLVDHLELRQLVSPGKELADVIDRIRDAKKPESAGGKRITPKEWQGIGLELAELGLAVVLAFLG